MKAARALAGAAAVAAAITLLDSVRPPSAIPEPEGPPTEEVAAPPRRFAPWPPFVLTWRVSASPERAAQAVEVSAATTWNPCGVVGTPTCYVRLAYDTYRRWSLAYSPDPAFEPADPIHLTVGELRYGVRDGVIVDLRDADRLPGPDVCSELLAAARRGDGTEVKQAAGRGLPREGWSVLGLSRPAEEARCYGPAGIPIAFRRLDHRWDWAGLALRSPLGAEIGWDLVRGHAEGDPPPACGEDAEEVPGWLLDLVAAGPLGPARREGSSVVLATRDLYLGDRSVRLWSQAPEHLLPGMRRRQVAPARVVEEAIQPHPLVSIRIGDLRLWLSIPEDLGSSRVVREQAAHRLGQMAVRLAEAAVGLPPPRPAPTCRP